MNGSSPFEIQVIPPPLAPAYQSEQESIVSLCFPFSRVPKEREERIDKMCNPAAIVSYVLALQNDHVIGTLTLHRRQIDYQKKTILLGGLAELGVIPEKRKIGVASAILKTAVSELARQNCDVAYLCAEINNPRRVGMYGAVGFTILPTGYTYVGKSGKRYTEFNGMLAPIMSKELYTAILDSQTPFDIGFGNL